MQLQAFYTPPWWQTERMPYLKSWQVSFWFWTRRQAPRDTFAFVWAAYRRWLWNLSRRCLLPVQFCWLSKLKCRSDALPSSHPSLCTVIVRTSVHFRVDLVWSCIRSDRATQLQKACQSRGFNIDSFENTGAAAAGWHCVEQLNRYKHVTTEEFSFKIKIMCSPAWGLENRKNDRGIF